MNKIYVYKSMDLAMERREKRKCSFKRRPYYRRTSCIDQQTLREIYQDAFDKVPESRATRKQLWEEIAEHTGNVPEHQWSARARKMRMFLPVISVAPGEWLPDAELINYLERLKDQRLFHFDFEYTNNIRSLLKRWRDLKERPWNRAAIAIHDNSHYRVIYIERLRSAYGVEYFDSFGTGPLYSKDLTAIANDVTKYVRDKYTSRLPDARVKVNSTAIQEGSVECGMFVLAYVDGRVREHLSMEEMVEKLHDQYCAKLRETFFLEPYNKDRINPKTKPRELPYYKKHSEDTAYPQSKQAFIEID